MEYLKSFLFIYSSICIIHFFVFRNQKVMTDILFDNVWTWVISVGFQIWFWSSRLGII